MAVLAPVTNAIPVNYREGLSRVMIRPAGRARRFSKSRGSSRRVGSEGDLDVMGQLGPGQGVFKSHGSGLVVLFRSDPRDVARPVNSPDYYRCLSKAVSLYKAVRIAWRDWGMGNLHS